MSVFALFQRRGGEGKRKKERKKGGGGRARSRDNLQTKRKNKDLKNHFLSLKKLSRDQSSIGG